MRPLVMVLAWTVACSRVGGEPAHEEHEEAGHEEHEEAGHAESVTLSAEGLVVAALRIAPASTRAASGAFTTSARVTLDPRREAQVSALAAGQVDRILVRAGDRVTSGQTLATVVSAELGEAVAAFHTAGARNEVAAARAERLRGLEGQGVSSRAEVAQAEAELKVAASELEAAEERLRVMGVRPDAGRDGHFPSRFPLRAPIAGEVLAADARVGQAVEPGAGLFHIGDLDEVWLLVDVYERDLANVAKGQPVRFAVDAWPDEVFTGTVDWVGGVVQPASRTIELRVVVPNVDHRLKPGMFARADLGLAVSDEAGAPALVVVPAEAVQDVEGRTVVFVQTAPDTFTTRTVRVASRHGSDVHLAEGLASGEPVVVEGAFTLKSELAKSELGEGHAH
jgi:cobalt-zinc-cadmium efflux system membrane fusion protein